MSTYRNHEHVLALDVDFSLRISPNSRIGWTHFTWQQHCESFGKNRPRIGHSLHKIASDPTNLEGASPWEALRLQDDERGE